MATPLTSAIVATFYITLITLLATAQFVRSRTPLRLGSAVMAILGLSISVLSIIHSIGNIAHPVYWIYQFVAECFAVTWLITTMIHLGYAFYPTTRHQTALWRTALASVVLYDLIAVAELSYYCYRVWGLPSPPHPPIPVPWIYWLRQVIKVLAFAVTIAYLFVPLVRHHKNANVSMLADRNTLAVGTWYLTALGVTFVGYSCVFVYYMTRPKEEVFSLQAQILDLCIRLICCPIFSLPPPTLLLDYFQTKHRSIDNPNTMIEEGITSNPRPQRPPLLAIQIKGSNQRNGNNNNNNNDNNNNNNSSSNNNYKDDVCLELPNFTLGQPMLFNPYLPSLTPPPSLPTMPSPSSRSPSLPPSLSQPNLSLPAPLLSSLECVPSDKDASLHDLSPTTFVPEQDRDPNNAMTGVDVVFR